MKCPKCGYQRMLTDEAPDWQCPSCGVAYAKVLQAQQSNSTWDTLIQRNAERNEEKLRKRRPVPFDNGIPLWLIILAGLLATLGGGFAAYAVFSSPDFVITCTTRSHRHDYAVTLNGRQSITMGLGFLFVTVAGICTLSRTIRYWVPGLIIFLGIGGIVTAATPHVWVCH